ncbi:tyrosine-type recombinase/integrase [Parasphingopyxis sp. CP4]|uniref:tyrosine-type recombinase/integrase n=1 Tax=Parasphingopyxis sp. CP4 TaxID=2724527 RepID=UPI0015A1DF03|nr:site-specific integrase [Parasphingopyxis sp. CP4]QLC20755.1 tyrosine-type recombinase/integrase [Parasphingopyxis sp. CP4]
MGSLNTTRIRAIREPGRYVDGDGLMLNVTKSGSKSWVMRIQKNGRRRDFGLGSLKDVTLSEARQLARDYRRMVKNGFDPIVERRRAASRMKTFREAAEAFFETNKPTWKNRKHRAQWMSTMEAYALPRLGDLVLADVDAPIICEVLDTIWLTKPETARRVRQRIGAVLDFAHSRGWRSREAPMRAVNKGLPKQPKQRGRFRAMPWQDVPAFVSQLEETESIGRLALRALVHTAARSGEIRGATWDEIDFGNRVWTVPAERMKAGKAHMVPLSLQAAQVFNRARELRIAGSNLVFPGQQPRKPLSDMTLLKILRDYQLPYTVHGFRSSFRDWAAEQSGLPGQVAEAALAHSIPNKTEAAYRRTNFLEKRRDLMQAWSEFLLMPWSEAEGKSDPDTSFSDFSHELN